MSIYAIADLHLPFGIEKPMDVFGGNWENYTCKIKKNWEALVKPNDLVIIAGDLSWATYLKEAIKDFDYLNDLPGKKIIIKGNHDYWWTTISKLKKFVEENHIKNIDFINNNCVIYKEEIAICGTRGWMCSEANTDVKIYNREMNRLKLSLEDARKKNPAEIIVALHYPPITNIDKDSDFVNLLLKYNVKKCVYGHLHGKESHKMAYEGIKDGIEYKLVSCDYTNFYPIKIY